MGETLHSDERELFKQLTQREKEPGKRVDELLWSQVVALENPDRPQCSQLTSLASAITQV